MKRKIVKPKNILLLIVVCLVMFLNIVFLFLHLIKKKPRIKNTSITYVLGKEINNKANLYLENVADDDEITIVDQDEINKNQQPRKQKITIIHRDKAYQININIIKPTEYKDYNPKPSSQNNIHDFIAGSSYQAIFKHDYRFLQDVKYSIPSSQLPIGKQVVSATLRGKTVSQTLYVHHSPYVLPKFNANLKSVVKQFLQDNQINNDQVAFSYHNITNQKTIHFNENTPMIAASTYKLPLAMTVEKQMSLHNYSPKTIVNDTTLEHLLKTSIVYSDNDTSLELVHHFGGWGELRHKQFLTFGKNKNSSIPSINDDNATTSAYFLQVLQYLWQNKNQYPLTTEYLSQATPNQYYETYLRSLDIWHKYGHYDSAINDVAIVYEKNPYLIALYTDGLTEQQFGTLAYIINEWHRLYQNPK